MFHVKHFPPAGKQGLFHTRTPQCPNFSSARAIPDLFHVKQFPTWGAMP